MPPETLAHFNPELCLKEADRSIPQRWTPVPLVSGWVWPVEAPARNQKDKDEAPCFITYQDHPRLAAPPPHPLRSHWALQACCLSNSFPGSEHLRPLIPSRPGIVIAPLFRPMFLSISCGLLMLFPNLCN